MTKYTRMLLVFDRIIVAILLPIGAILVLIALWRQDYTSAVLFGVAVFFTSMLGTILISLSNIIQAQEKILSALQSQQQP